MSDKRDGEIAADIDPATQQPDAGLIFIGRIRSPWKTRAECPKNMRQARERGPENCSLEIDPQWRPGLTGLEAGSFIHILYWMHDARRDLIMQKPRHRQTATGVFSLRSPVRPNPLALALVQILDIDVHSGHIAIEATDALDGTALVDIKPYLETVDAPHCA